MDEPACTHISNLNTRSFYLHAWLIVFMYHFNEHGARVCSFDVFTLAVVHFCLLHWNGVRLCVLGVIRLFISVSHTQPEGYSSALHHLSSLSACRYTFTSAYRKCTCSISQNLYWMSSQSNNVTIGNDIYAFKKKWLKMIESNCWNLVLTLFWPSLYAPAMLLIPGQHRYTCDWWECASNSVCVDRIKGPINVCENIQQKMLGII